VVSGAGPSVLVLTDETGERRVAGRAPSGWEALAVPIARYGVHVLPSGRQDGPDAPE
jgi:homoserine kinase